MDQYQMEQAVFDFGYLDDIDDIGPAPAEITGYPLTEDLRQAWCTDATEEWKHQVASPSIPEPPPLPKGVEVTPLLIKWLSRIPLLNPEVISLVESRRLYGIQKYGQSLMSQDGRNGLEDARQEAGDLLQYLFKEFLTREASIDERELRVFRHTLHVCNELIDVLTTWSPESRRDLIRELQDH